MKKQEEQKVGSGGEYVGGKMDVEGGMKKKKKKKIKILKKIKKRSKTKGEEPKGLVANSDVELV